MRDRFQIRQAWIWVGLRIAVVFLALLLLAGLFYVLGGTGGGVGLAWGLTALFILPFSLGAILQFALDPNGSREQARVGLITAGLIVAISVIIGVFAREGLICIAILAIPWWGSAVLGAGMVSGLHQQFRQRAVLHSVSLAILPFLFLFLGPFADNSTHYFEVRRSIIIDAPAGEVWPHLLELEGLSDDEGVFTIAQNLLGIPRPRSAVVMGDGAGAIRLAQWGDHITFEEHVTDWHEGSHLAWRFVFPNDSVANYTDAHIGPESEYLGIESGGYRLTTLPDGRTRLTLTTRYRASSPANHYAALWGEIILGGIQRNILVIISERVAV